MKSTSNQIRSVRVPKIWSPREEAQSRVKMVSIQRARLMESRMLREMWDLNRSSTTLPPVPRLLLQGLLGRALRVMRASSLTLTPSQKTRAVRRWFKQQIQIVKKSLRYRKNYRNKLRISRRHQLLGLVQRTVAQTITTSLEFLRHRILQRGSMLVRRA